MLNSFHSAIALFTVVFVGNAHAADQDTITPRDAVKPTQRIQLFNGKDFNGLYTWLQDTKYEDPDDAFSVSDGMIHCKGGKYRGYIGTKQNYKDYHLSVEYKWGKQTDGGKYVRNSGVMLHSVGADGSTSRGTWITSLEVQLAQGCEGDFIVIRGKDKKGNGIKSTINSRVRIAVDKKTRWDPNGKLTAYSGRQFWWKDHQPFFKELLDTRGKNDVASPYGQWTKVECICRGDKVSVKINGVLVNVAEKVWPTAGRIMLQNEGHEVWFRKFELKPILGD